MKKILNILFWIAIGVLAVVIANNVYNRYMPDIELSPAAPDSRQEDNEAKEPSVLIPAPDFSLKDINGNEVKLSDYRGKIVFLNFWAVWCPYCVREMPDLDSANKKLLEGNDAAVITVDVNEELETVKRFVEEKGLSLPVLMDYDGRVSIEYGVSGFPTTFVISREGNILGFREGPLTEEQVLSLVEELK